MSIITKQATELEKKNYQADNKKVVSWAERRTMSLRPSCLEDHFPRKDVAEMSFYKLLNCPSKMLYPVLNREQIMGGIASLLMIECHNIKTNGLTESERDFLLYFYQSQDTKRHVLHLSLKVRLEPDGSRLYKVKLYDPNRSFQHKSVAVYDLSIIRDKLKLADFFEECTYNLYFEKSQYNSFIFHQVVPDFMDNIVTTESLIVYKQQTYKELPQNSLVVELFLTLGREDK